MAASYQTLGVTRAEPRVARITLDRPAKRNALGPRMIAELVRALSWAGDDEAVRSVVLTGAGSVFCAGADLDALASGGEALRPGGLADVLVAIHQMEKPVIAQVNGDAVAGGLGFGRGVRSDHCRRPCAVWHPGDSGGFVADDDHR